MSCKYRLLNITLILLLSGCAQVGVKRDGLIHQLETFSFEEVVDNSVLPIKAWSRIKNRKGPVHIYIEGDGHAWSGRGRPSLDPTPENPVALELALKDSADNVIYVARPCQFIRLPDANCHFKVWTTERYSAFQTEAVRHIIESVIDPAQPVVLIGFSGGAYIALSLASKMRDIDVIITVAGNINLEAFASYHNIPTPDSDALPDSFLRLPQFYLTGENDRVISPELTMDILQQYPPESCYAYQVLEGTDHSGPWSIPWKAVQALQSRCQQ